MTRKLIPIAVLFLSSALLAAENAPQPGSARLATLVGLWSGEAEMKEADKPPVKLRVRLDCRAASGGWGVRCDASMVSPEMKYLETDLFGYDAETDKVHWYSVTNAGEVHDHSGNWIDDSRLVVRHTAQNFAEDITLALNGKNEITFQSVSKTGGATTATVSGDLKRR